LIKLIKTGRLLVVAVYATVVVLLLSLFSADTVRTGCCVAVATQQPDAPAYTNCDIALENFAPDDGLKSPKHVEHLMINKDSL
jgi:hypothetical protein